MRADSQRLDRFWLFCGVTVLAALVGCPAQPASTVQGPKFEVAGDSPAAPAGDPAPNAGTPIPPPPLGIPEATAPSAKPKPLTPPKGSVTMPDAGGENADSPEARALLVQLAQVSQKQPEGATAEEQQENFAKLQLLRLRMADALLAMKASHQTQDTAVTVIVEANNYLEQMGDPNAMRRIIDFAKKLNEHPNPKLVKRAREMLFEIAAAGCVEGKGEGFTELEAAIDGMIAESPDEATFDLLTRTCFAFAQNGLTKQAEAIMGKIVQGFGKHENPDVVSQVAILQDSVVLLSSGYPAVLEAAVKGGPEERQTLLAKIDELLKTPTRGQAVLSQVQQLLAWLEGVDRPMASQLLDLTDAAYKDSANPKLVETATQLIASSRKHLALVGEPFEVQGKSADDSPFDWSALQGKVVLVDFWATWCLPCLQELPNIKQNYDAYHDQGFEVVGVNMDEDREKLTKFLTRQPLPWPTVVVGEGQEIGIHSAMAKAAGVESLPFVILIGRDGKVDSLHVRGKRLEERLTQLIGPPPKSDPFSNPPGETPPPEKAAEKPAADEVGAAPANTPPASERPAFDKPGGDEAPVNTLRPKTIKRTSAEEEIEDEAEEAPAAAKTCGGEEEPAAEKPAQKPVEKPAEKSAVATDETINPYAAKPGLSTEKLVDYVLRMQDKAKSIRTRKGFSPAVIDACERVLKAAPSESLAIVAIECKGIELQRWAANGAVEVEDRLREFVKEFAEDKRPRVVRVTDCLSREVKLTDALAAPVEGAADVLADLKTYYEAEKLDGRHLRMASNTVALINRIEDADEREKRFQEFGGIFAKSKDRELARYGKKLAQATKSEEAEFIGKEIELAGTDVEGGAFDIKELRGKVVVVDFWATWCGPCRKEMPKVQQLHAQHNERGLEVVGVSLDADLDALKTFLEENALPWKTLAGDQNQAAADRYGVRGIPTMMLIDREGKIRAVAHSIDSLKPQIEKLLAG